jgi:uncharacterized protein (TIGR02246 family)
VFAVARHPNGGLADWGTRRNLLWDRGDAEALAGLYTGDATLVMAPRDPVDGRDAIRAYFEESFAKRPPHLRHVTAVQRIEMLAPDVAFVDTDVRLERREDDVFVADDSSVHELHGRDSRRRHVADQGSPHARQARHHGARRHVGAGEFNRRSLTAERPSRAF